MFPNLFNFHFLFFPSGDLITRRLDIYIDPHVTEMCYFFPKPLPQFFFLFILLIWWFILIYLQVYWPFSPAISVFSMRSIHRNLYSNITLIFSFTSSFCFLLMDSIFLLKFPIVHYKHVFLKHSFTSCFKILSANSGFVILWSVSTWLSCLWGIGYFSYFFVCLVILDFYLVLCEWYIVHCECIYIFWILFVLLNKYSVQFF